MIEHLDKYADEGLEFETKEMMAKYSLEVIASTGFGVEANAFTDPNGIFSDRVRKLQIAYLKKTCNII